MGVPVGVLAECFFENGSWGIQCRYHAALAATNKRAAKNRAMRGNEECALPSEAGFGFREGVAGGIRRLIRITGFGKGFASNERDSSRSIGSVGEAWAVVAAGGANEFPAADWVCNDFNCWRNASTSRFRASISFALGAGAEARGLPSTVREACTSLAASCWRASAGTSSESSGKSMPQKPGAGSLNSKST